MSADREPQLRKFLSSSAPLFLLLCLQVLPYFFYRHEVAYRPITLLIPLWDWMYSMTGLCGSIVLCLGWGVVAKLRHKPFLPKSKVLWGAMSVASAWALLLNPFVWKTLPQLPISVLFLLAAVFLSIAFFRAFSYVIWFGVLLLSLLQYIAHSQGLLMNWMNLMEVFTTSWEDAKPYLTPLNISLLIGSVVLAFAAYHVMYRVIRRHTDIPAIGFTGALLMVMFFLAAKPLQHHLVTGSEYIWPIGNTEVVVSESGRAAVYVMRISKIMDIQPPMGTTQAHSDLLCGNEPVICILHIGESARTDHLSLYGYSRKTTPFLDSLDNLIVFKDCISSGTSTDRTVPVILTNARRDFLSSQDKSRQPNSPPLPDFFDACRYSCASFWGKGILDGPPQSLFTREVHFVTRCMEKNYEHDDAQPQVQLQQIEDYIASHAQKPLFLLLNNRGSHAFFEWFDHENPPFTPVRVPSGNDEPFNNPEHAVIYRNAYDGTIHYTDHYIEQLFDRLKGKPFLYMYVSDHGEYIGDEGYWVRGNAPHSIYYKHGACRVPFFVYASPELETAHPHFREALEKLRSRQELSTAHEHIFHTLLGFFGIQTPYYDETLDLCSDKVKPYSGPHPDRDGKEAQE